MVVIGHSAGAVVALAFALEHPERVRGLVLLAPAPIDSGPPARVAAAFRLPFARRWAPMLLRAGRPFVGRSVAATWHDRPTFLRSPMAQAYAESTKEDGWAEGLVELTLASSSDDAHAVVTGRLGDLRIPILVIAGSDDRIVRPTAIRKLVDRLPDIHLVEIPACGHVPHEERPIDVVAEVTTFLASLDGHG